MIVPIKMPLEKYLFPSPPYLDPELLLGPATSDIRLQPPSFDLPNRANLPLRPSLIYYPHSSPQI